MVHTEALEYLYQLQRHGIRPGLERMDALLTLLHHPERQFQSVHIAGTNGKGSTAAMAASALVQGGYTVGLYTSPHLVDFSERMTVSGTPISHEEIVQLTERICEMIRSRSPRLLEEISFFEFTTAMAFLHFSENNVDLAVVEVGMGGRFDATNLLSPLVTGITHIGMDHQQYLGSTLKEIAAEKAGIIKENTPTVTSVSQPELLSVLEEKANAENASLIRLGHEIQLSDMATEQPAPFSTPQRFFYDGLKERCVECRLLGRHQIENAAVAIGLLEQLGLRGFPLSDQDLLEGIRRVSWEGRLEIIQKRPLILLDGAHNPSSAERLAAFLSNIDPERSGKHWMIIGMMSDKNIQSVLSPLLPWPDALVISRPEIKRAADPNRILGCFHRLSKGSSARKRFPSCTVRETTHEALEEIKALIQPGDTLVISGSLYIVGEAKALLAGTTPSLIRG
ncbi:MAG: bifunctional folylpolyglutamate synthase/dihydrofolate synthase [Nitrospiria bacterium]